MNFRLCFVLYIFLIVLNAFVTAGRDTSQNNSGVVGGTAKKPPPTSPENDDTYNDEEDDDLEGSGSGGVGTDGKYDLDMNGSGFGPDDEDAHQAVTFAVNSNSNVRLKSLTDPPELPNSPETESPPVPSSSSERPEPTQLSQQPRLEQPSSSEKQPTDKTVVSVKTDNNHVHTSTADKTPPMEDDNHKEHDVYSVSNRDKDKTISFFAQPGILAAVIGGAVVGLLCAILVVMFIVYRMRKKDEGSYALDEMKRTPATNPYMKTNNHREFYA